MKIYYSYDAVQEFAALTPTQIEKLSAAASTILLESWQFWVSAIVYLLIFAGIGIIIGGGFVRAIVIMVFIITGQLIFFNVRLSIMKELLKDHNKPING